MLDHLTTNNFANEEARALADGEIERLRSYKKIYLETHPLPKKRAIHFLTALGLEAMLIAASSIAAVIVAGLRTYDAFYTMFNSANTPLLFTWIGSIAAIVAVEGLLLATGLIQGKERGTKLSAAGTITAFIISMAAGFVVSLSPIQDKLMELFKVSQYALSIATAIGASVLAYVGGLVSGSILFRWADLQVKADTDYEKQVLSWDESAQRAYHKQGRTGIFGLESLQTEVTIKKKAKPTKEAIDIAQAVRGYLKNHDLNASDVGQEPGLTMTPAQLAKEINAGGGAVRTALSRIRSEEKMVHEDEVKEPVSERTGDSEVEPKYVPVDDNSIF